MHLNEELIISQSQQTNFVDVKFLNLWGFDLTNISLLKNLPNLEILILSANRINSLKGLQNCVCLQELELRNNDIRDLNELNYLQNTRLNYLDLSDNPCCRCEDYRISVLKLLPNLRTLDRTDVTDVELELAMNLKNLEFTTKETNATNQNQHTGKELTPHMQSSSCHKLELELSYQKTPTPSMNVAYNMSQAGSNECVCIQNSRHEFAEQRNQHLSQLQWARKPRKQFCKSMFSTPRDQWRSDLQQQQYLRHSLTNKQQRTNFNHKVSPPSNRRHTDYGQCHHSQMDVNEWLQMQVTPNKTVNHINQNSKRGSVSERGIYTICDNRQFFRGNATSRPSQSRYSITGRVPSIAMDSASNVSSPTSSVLSSSQDYFWAPRSRRVNLLCASLRFVLELDILTLVDVLNSVRERIEELCTN